MQEWRRLSAMRVHAGADQNILFRMNLLRDEFPVFEMPVSSDGKLDGDVDRWWAHLGLQVAPCVVQAPEYDLRDRRGGKPAAGRAPASKSDKVNTARQETLAA